MASSAANDSDLSWEDIQHSQSAPATAPPPPAASAPSREAQAASNGGAAAAGGLFAFLTLAYYRELFDVTTRGVLRRLLAAYWGFLRPSLLQLAEYVPVGDADDDSAGDAATTDGATAPTAPSPGVGEATGESDGSEGGGGPVSLFTTKPDLYGPMWISATLVFLIGAMANLGSWATFTPDENGSLWRYDFSLVTQAFALVGGSVAVVPAAAWAVLRYHGAPPVSLVTLVCLWGYSLVHYVPATLLCAIPSVGVRWAAAAFAAVGAALFLTRAIVPLVRDSNALVAPVVLTVAGLQFVLGLLLRLYFFSYTIA